MGRQIFPSDDRNFNQCINKARAKDCLFGDLKALISLGIGPNEKHPLANAEGVQVTLVAGAGFEPATFRL